MLVINNHGCVNWRAENSCLLANVQQQSVSVRVEYPCNNTNTTRFSVGSVGEVLGLRCGSYVGSSLDYGERFLSIISNSS